MSFWDSPGVTDHSELENVTSGQHHTKPTSTQAKDDTTTRYYISQNNASPDTTITVDVSSVVDYAEVAKDSGDSQFQSAYARSPDGDVEITGGASFTKRYVKHVDISTGSAGSGNTYSTYADILLSAGHNHNI